MLPWRLRWVRQLLSLSNWVEDTGNGIVPNESTDANRRAFTRDRPAIRTCANQHQPMNATPAFKTAMNHPLFPLALLAVLFFMPHAMIVVCPAYLVAQISLFPDRYRSRSGSLKMAICLFAGISLALAVIGVPSLVRGNWI